MSAVITAQTLFDKIWQQHCVLERDDGQTLLYIDRHYLGDDLPAEVFQSLQRREIPVRRPQSTFAMPDHYVSTHGRTLEDVVDDERRGMIRSLSRYAEQEGISQYGLDDPRQGIVHVVGPEQGLSLPGMTIVCGDSHTSTHGALGALGFGIGASEVAHVLATQTLWQRKPRNMRVLVEGRLGPGVTAKDLILAIVHQIGVAGGTQHVIEYGGSAIRALSMEGRMTLCNMTIEAGARAGMIAPDETTFAYLRGRPHAPHGADWHRDLARWRGLVSDPGAVFEREVCVDATDVLPMVTWGVTPAQCAPISGHVPDPERLPEADRILAQRALAYMGLRAGTPLEGLPVDRVFIGSCTNGRIEDLRAAASVVQGRRARVPTMVVPGSRAVRSMAEAEGLDQIFLAAGMAWLEPGCSMCLAINGDVGRPGERCASTTNRNFVGRQGPGVRTHLLSPAMAAAAAIHGCLSDVRGEPQHAAV